MPVTYEYRGEDGTVRTRPTGVLTVMEVIEYFRQVAGDPAVQEGSVEVVYFDGVLDFAFCYSEAADIVVAYGEVVRRKKCVATLFVASSPLAYGIARMLSTIHGEDDAVRILRNEEEVAAELARRRPRSPERA